MSHHNPNKLPEGVTPKYLPDGKENPKYVDLLEEDKPIAGQKFVCLSFVSPEHIIKQKEHFILIIPGKWKRVRDCFIFKELSRAYIQT